MGEPERVTRELEAARREAAAAAARREEADIRVRKEIALNEIRKLIERALAALEAAHYPDGRMVEIEPRRKRFWRGGWTQSVELAGWPVAQTWRGVKTEHATSGKPGPGTVFLLSGGQLWYGRDALTGDDLFHRDFGDPKDLAEHVMDGLQNIIKTYGPKPAAPHDSGTP